MAAAEPGERQFRCRGIGPPFYSFVKAAVSHGITSGYSCGGPGEPCDGQDRPYFRPGDTAIRGEIAKIVDGALNSSQTCTGPTLPEHSSKHGLP
ncbi:MAG TPA: hypothetical protein VM536_21460 [Chloroflexia bacterium]|nr:hypothetical protein [Chloroflexia bacterium]